MLSEKMAVSSLFFSACDADESGSIDREEFSEALHGMRSGVPDSVCDALFDDFDADGSGTISYDEYCRYVLRDTLRRKSAQVMASVKQWDLDGSGEIEQWEFRRAIGSMGVVAPSQAMVDDYFVEMDLDHSGSLSFAEIRSHLKSLHHRYHATPRGLRAPACNSPTASPHPTPRPPGPAGPSFTASPRPPPPHAGEISFTASPRPTLLAAPSASPRSVRAKGRRRIDISDSSADIVYASSSTQRAHETRSLPMMRPPPMGSPMRAGAAVVRPPPMRSLSAGPGGGAPLPMLSARRPMLMLPPVA